MICIRNGSSKFDFDSDKCQYLLLCEYMLAPTLHSEHTFFSLALSVINDSFVIASIIEY